MKTFRYSVSFESDLAPVDTARGEVHTDDADDAIRRAVFRAFGERTSKVKFRSVVVVVEDLAAVREKTANKIKGSSEPTSDGLDSERRDECSGTGLAGNTTPGVSPVSAPITGEEINRRVQAEQDARAENRALEGAGGLKHAES